MSYRAFKRLLGETSLERKCRFLFGAATLLLITGSFLLYARQTDHLAYAQIPTTCRLLVQQIIDKKIATKCRPDHRSGGPAGKPGREADRSVARGVSQQLGGEMARATAPITKRSSSNPARPRPENRPDSNYSLERLKEFQADDSRQEDVQDRLAQHKYYYYGAIRANASCLTCHRRLTPDLKENGVIAVVRIELSTSDIEEGVHRNWPCCCRRPS